MLKNYAGGGGNTEINSENLLCKKENLAQCTSSHCFVIPPADRTYNEMISRHLGRNASVLQQHPGPHGRVTGHKLPVPADLGGSQQGFGIQVGEDAEESGAHLQDLWTDHLVGFGGALFMAAGLVVDTIRAACVKRESLL